MSIADIRERLHQYLEMADDRKIEAIYVMVEDEIGRHDAPVFSANELAFLEHERQKHFNGESKSYSWEAAKQIIRKKL